MNKFIHKYVDWVDYIYRVSMNNLVKLVLEGIRVENLVCVSVWEEWENLLWTCRREEDSSIPEKVNFIFSHSFHPIESHKLEVFPISAHTNCRHSHPFRCLLRGDQRGWDSESEERKRGKAGWWKVLKWFSHVREWMQEPVFLLDGHVIADWASSLRLHHTRGNPAGIGQWLRGPLWFKWRN